MNLKARLKNYYYYYYYYYYYIVGNFIIVFAANIYSNNKQLHDYAKMLESNTQVMNLLKSSGLVLKLAQQANAPGNDLFNSRNLSQEKKRQKVANDEFKLGMSEIKRLANQQASSKERSLSLEKIELIQQSFDRMNIATVSIFEFYQTTYEIKATKHMAEMDRHFGHVLSAIENFRSYQTDLQLLKKNNYNAALQSGKKTEQFFLLVALFTVFGLSYYGYRFAKFAKDSASKIANFKEVLDSTLDMIFMFEMDSLRFTYLNQGAIVSMGYSREELLEMKPYQINPFVPEIEFRQIITPLLTGEQSSLRFETLYRRKDGTDFTVNILLQLARQNDGSRMFVAIVRDTTERNKVTAELQRLNDDLVKKGNDKLDELTEILSTTPSCLKIINSNGELLKMNNQGLDLIEAENFQCVFKANVYDIVEVSHRAKYIEFNQRICSGKKESLIFEIIGLKGTRRWMESYSAPYKLPSGEIAHIAITNEITARVNLENEYERQQEVAQHDAEFASLGELSAGVAHEINNPLAIITGALSLLVKFKDNPEKFASRIDSIERAARRIEKIVKGLIKFSRTSDGVTYKNEALEDIVAEVLILTEAKAKSNSIPIIVSAEKGLNILCDLVDIEQVIISLVSNAIDVARGQPEKWVKINCFTEAQHVVLQVMDSGSGISKSVELKMLQPFFTTKPVGEGIGLGLSISKGILDNHNAEIKLNRNFSNTCLEIRFQKIKDTQNAT